MNGLARVALCVVSVSVAGCQSCVDVGPHHYRCDPKSVQAGDCPGDWHCGLEGFCHDPTAAEAWRCAPGTAGDCAPNWHCGLEGICHDQADGGPWLCFANDAGDCAPGWQCGLNDLRTVRECHPPAAPREYACELDSDCTAAWRCGVDRRCVDPSADALVSHAATLQPPAVLSPKLMTRAPRLLAVSPVEIVDGVNGPTPHQTVAAMDDDRLVIIDRTVGVVPAIGSNPTRVKVIEGLKDVVKLASLGAYTYQRIDQSHTRDWDYQVGSFTYALLGDGGFFEVGFSFDGGSLPGDLDGFPYRHFEDYDEAPVDFAASAMKLGSHVGEAVPMLLVFDQTPQETSPLVLFTQGALSTGFALDAFPEAPGQPTNRLIDSTALYFSNDDEADTCVISADERGLWVANMVDDGFSGPFLVNPIAPLLLPGFDNDTCSRPTSRRVVGLDVALDKYLAIRSHLKSGSGPDELTLFDVSHWSQTVSGSTYLFGCSAPLNAQCYPDGLGTFPVTGDYLYGPCAPCPSGEITGFQVLAADGQPTPAIEVRCREGAGANATEHTVVVNKGGSVIGGSCSLQTISGESGLFRDVVTVAEPSSGAVAFAGRSGQVWQGASSATVVPLTFDRPPVGVARHGADVPLMFTDELIGWPVPQLGVLGVSVRGDGSRPVAAVAGKPDWVVLKSGAAVSLGGSDAGLRQLVPPSPSGSLGEQSFAALADRRDGGHELLVGSGDTLFATDVSNESFTLPLQSKLVPFPGSAVVAIAPLTSEPGGPLIEAFVLTRGGVSRVRADSDVAWTATQVPLPVGPVPIAVWAEGRAGRVGFDDGTIFSLHSVVPLSNAINDPHVYDFVVLCGQPWALGSNGLYKLELAAGEKVGSWSKVASPVVGPGKLLRFETESGSQSLLVFDQLGRAVTFAIDHCP